MPFFYKTIDGQIATNEFIIRANGETMEPLACEKEGCASRAFHAYLATDITGPGKHHPKYVLFCDKHATEFAQT